MKIVLYFLILAIFQKQFKDIDLDDIFFNTLKDDYSEFDIWFKKKADNNAYVHYNSVTKNIEGFLYLKMEYNFIENISENISSDKILKIGTFKVNPHGTKLGERFIKLSLDFAIKQNATLCYLTIFNKHQHLIDLVERYGFVKKGHTNRNINEDVYVKNLNIVTNDTYKDFPLINLTNNNKIYLLSVYPKYHSKLFPDSLLNTEKPNILEDLSFTNSIHKAYVSNIKDIKNLKKGDIIVIYKTAEKGKSAKYNSVATSICIVDEVKSKKMFVNFDAFYNYTSAYSIFDKSDLMHYYNKADISVLKLTYNLSLSKRLTRNCLIEDIGIDGNQYWGFIELNIDQLQKIIKKGEVNECAIIN